MRANRARSRAGGRRWLHAILWLVRVLAACALIAGGAAPPAAQAAVGPTSGGYVPAEVLVGWQAAGASPAGWPEPLQLGRTAGSAEYQSAVEAIRARTGLRVLQAHLSYAAARLAVPAGQEQAEIARLLKLPGVRYAELNYIAHAALVPSDPFYSQQWSLARVSAAPSWDLATGSSSVVVAVIDSGIDFGHAEFTGRLIGPGSGAYNFIAHNAYPIDDLGHGTHVAGIVAAGINGVGVVGLAPGVRILPLKVLGPDGTGTYDRIVEAINWATDWSASFPHPGDPHARVRVINLSLGGFEPSDALQIAVDRARAQGILVVAAAGNCGQGCTVGLDYLFNPNYYPAATSGVLAVGATDSNDRWTGYSGYKSYVGISAPGGLQSGQILSTLPYAMGDHGGYGSEYGTSMATPLVSGAAALAWSLWPEAQPAEISAALTGSADKVPLSDAVCAYDNVALKHSPCFGYGRLNALGVVRLAYPPSLQATFTEAHFLFSSDEAIGRRTFDDPLLNPSERVVTWRATVTSGAQWLSTTPGETADPTQSTYSVPGMLSLTAQPGSLPTGDYTGVVQVLSVYPFDLAANFNLTVTMQITDSLFHAYLPALNK